MTLLFAQPYNINAQGFYFDNTGDYHQKVKNCFDAYGVPVEEFEIQFIDGDAIDARLFQSWGVNQVNFHSFIEAAETLSGHDKIALIALGESGYLIDENINRDDVELHYCENLEALAYQFIEEGLYGPIPDAIAGYIDYDAIARDLGFEYSELKIAGQHIIYRCP